MIPDNARQHAPRVRGRTRVRTTASFGVLDAQSVPRGSSDSPWVEVLIDPRARDYTLGFLDALVCAVWPCTEVVVTGYGRCADEVRATLQRRLTELHAVEHRRAS